MHNLYKGGWYKEGVDVDEEAKVVARDVLAGKKANEVDYGRQDNFNPEELVANRKKQRTHKNELSVDEDFQYSVKEIVGESGTSYGIGVYLDSDRLSRLTDEERIREVKEYVQKIGGRSFVAYDKNGTAVNVHIAESSRTFKNKKGRKVFVNNDLTSFLKKEIKQEAVILVDELISKAKYDTSGSAKYPHGWLDNYGKNDWEYWTVYIQ